MRSGTTVDAIVIGAGPNGLVAANLLAQEDWDVVVLEAQPSPGGAVRSAELITPGFTHDLYSSFYPLGMASPVIQELELDRYGLQWTTAPLTLAHPTPDGRTAVLSTDIDVTAASLDTYADGDGEAWRELYELWERTGDHLIEVLLRPFPPIRAGTRLAKAVGKADMTRFVRHLLLPVRRMAEEHFRGDGARLLLAGNALHADFSPETPGSGLFGWLLASLGQQIGFPVPVGGAQKITDALVARLAAHRGEVQCNSGVRKIEVDAGRATGVRLDDGRRISARRAILADVGAPRLYFEMIGAEHLPHLFIEDLRRFQYDNPTVKVDWALREHVPWTSAEARQAGVVHIADTLDDLTRFSADLTTGVLSEHPLVLVGQTSTTDPTRSPPGTETVWAYTHVPRGLVDFASGATASHDKPMIWRRDDTERVADRVQAEIERLAPGFSSLVIGRHVMGPDELESGDANLVAGAVNGGTAQLHQQLFFRPTPGFARAETPVRGLFLASASAHPGGAVHGAPGANAARAALWAQRRRSTLDTVAPTRLTRVLKSALRRCAALPA